MTKGQAQVTYYVSEGDIPSSWEFIHENSAFLLEIRQGTATFKLHEPVSSLDEAEGQIEEFLHSWAADLLLQTGGVHRKFRLHGSYASGIGGRASITGVLSIAHSAESKANLRRRAPWQFHEFEDDPLTASLIARYHDFRKGKERLAVLGYLCLNVLESRFGSRSRLSEECRIDMKVLGKFADRVSMVGTYRTARKISRSHKLRDFTAAEQFWVERVIRELILRAGEVAKGVKPLSRLSAKDLPFLPPLDGVASTSQQPIRADSSPAE